MQIIGCPWEREDVKAISVKPHHWRLQWMTYCTALVLPTFGSRKKQSPLCILITVFGKHVTKACSWTSVAFMLNHNHLFFHQKPVHLAMMCALICIWTVMWCSCFQNSTPAGSFQSCITPFTVRGLSWPDLIWSTLFIWYFHQRS